MRNHLRNYGFLKNYKIWINHGESYVPLHGNQQNEHLMDLDAGDNTFGMINDALRNPHIDLRNENDEQTAYVPQTGIDEETKKYFKLLEDAQTELYPGCLKFSSLSFVVRLLHIKVLNKGTDKHTDMILQLLNEAFPQARLPSSYYQAKKLIEDLGFTYETWDACPNSCMLFRKEDLNLDACVICDSFRWKLNDVIPSDRQGRRTKIAAK